MFSESKETKKVEKEDVPDNETASKILKRVGIADETAKAEETEPKENPLSKLTTMFGNILGNILNRNKPEEEMEAIDVYKANEPDEIPEQNIENIGTASLKLDTEGSALPIQADKNSLEQALHQMTEEQIQLKEKYDNLHKLFKEKDLQTEKLQTTLEQEQKQKKDFNKEKDVLEKEIKDTKDAARKLNIELSTAQTEIEGYKSRINQLESKVTQHEKEITEYEDNGKRGHPPIFNSSLRNEFIDLDNSSGLNQVVRSHGNDAIDLSVEDPGVLATFNTENEFLEFKNIHIP